MSKTRRALTPSWLQVPSEEWRYIVNELSSACLVSIGRLGSGAGCHTLHCSRCGAGATTLGSAGPARLVWPDSLCAARECTIHCWRCTRCGRTDHQSDDPCF